MNSSLMRSQRLSILVCMVAAACVAMLALNPPNLPSGDRWPVLQDMLGALFTPALTYEEQVPSSAPPFLLHLAAAAGNTVLYAGAGLGLSLVLGFLLGVLGSRSISRRFSPHDLLEAILHPEKSVPTDYQSVSIATSDGKVFTGQIVNLSNKVISLRTDALKPANLTNVSQDKIEEIVPSQKSLMPAGLLDTFSEQEIRQLLAWLHRDQ